MKTTSFLKRASSRTNIDLVWRNKFIYLKIIFFVGKHCYILQVWLIQRAQDWCDISDCKQEANFSQAIYIFLFNISINISKCYTFLSQSKFLWTRVIENLRGDVMNFILYCVFVFFTTELELNLGVKYETTDSLPFDNVASFTKYMNNHKFNRKFRKIKVQVSCPIQDFPRSTLDFYPQTSLYCLLPIIFKLRGLCIFDFGCFVLLRWYTVYNLSLRDREIILFYVA